MEKVKHILINIEEDRDWSWAGAPRIEGFKQISLQIVEIDGKRYEKLEYIPAHVNLCDSQHRRINKDDIISIEEVHGVEQDDIEHCISCGKVTIYKKSTHVDNRKYYIEGSGQLCQRCYEEIY